MRDIENLILVSFEELLKRKSFSEVTVTDIIENCGISRMTFYRYFHDKYEIPRKFYKSILEASEAEYKNTPYSNTTFTRIILRQLWERKPFVVKCMAFSGQNALIDYICETTVAYNSKRVAEAIALSQRISLAEVPAFSFDIESAIRMYSIGTVWLVKEWLDKDCNASSEEVARAISRNVPITIAEYFDTGIPDEELPLAVNQ